VDTAKAAGKDAPVVMITNGYINPKPLKEILEYVPAVKVDLKAFTEKFYREHCYGELKPVLDSLVRIKKARAWLEIVVLIIPTLNDSEGEIRRMARWIKENLGTDVPIHFSRFHPMYKMKNLPSTPVENLENCRNIAMEEGLHYAYMGNVPGHKGENTYCPECETVLIKRTGFYIFRNSVKDGKCPECGRYISGIWS
jgi:pyruvate formate lyase activating enzyme